MLDRNWRGFFFFVLDFFFSFLKTLCLYLHGLSIWLKKNVSLVSHPLVSSPGFYLFIYLFLYMELCLQGFGFVLGLFSKGNKNLFIYY